MAAFVRYWPGPDINAYSSVLLDVFNQALLELQNLYVTAGPIDPGTPSGNWFFAGWSHVSGVQPYWKMTWLQTSGLNTWEVRLRYWTGFVGAVDPSFLFAAGHRWPYDILMAKTVAQFNTYVSYIGAGWPGALGGIGVVLITMCASGPPVIANVGQTYTDGPRAGQPWGLSVAITYNPSASELLGGIHQMDVRRTATCSDAADGTLNVVDGVVDVGVASSVVPVPTFVTSEASSSWTSWTAITSSVWNLFSVTSNTIITNEGDLGAPSPPATEPTGPVVNIFNRPGVPQELVGPTGPTVFQAITTLPGKLLALMEGAGWFVLSLVAGGFIAKTLTALTAAPAALLLGAGEEVALVAGSEVAVAAAFALPPAVVATTALVTHEANSALVTYQASRQATAQIRIAEALEAGGSGLSPEADQAIQDLAAAFKPGPDPLVPSTMYDLLKRTHVMLQAVAETRQELTLRAKGIEVEAMTGSLTGP